MYHRKVRLHNTFKKSNSNGMYAATIEIKKCDGSILKSVSREN